MQWQWVCDRAGSRPRAVSASGCLFAISHVRLSRSLRSGWRILCVRGSARIPGSSEPRAVRRGDATRRACCSAFSSTGSRDDGKL